MEKNAYIQNTNLISCSLKLSSSFISKLIKGVTEHFNNLKHIVVISIEISAWLNMITLIIENKKFNWSH